MKMETVINDSGRQVDVSPEYVTMIRAFSHIAPVKTKLDDGSVAIENKEIITLDISLVGGGSSSAKLSRAEAVEVLSKLGRKLLIPEPSEEELNKTSKERSSE